MPNKPTGQQRITQIHCALVICATQDNVRVLKCILRCFEKVSGLKINYSKSHFGCLGKSEAWCRDAAQFLNCTQLEFPFSYLGIPIGVRAKSWTVWQPIIRNFEAKLAKWKQRCLCMGGRITLLNSVLTAFPIYLLSFFRNPKKVVQKIVSIQTNFLWGGHLEANKIPWVKWDTVCLPKIVVIGENQISNHPFKHTVLKSLILSKLMF